ncbi:folate-binding protein YgfZ [Thiohalophilus sp.]|uniref:CAF17-like 4Fe-4S cluster assembly/insertion protein YgfZ n=1 Tax=Thiohalophilus sp. TaxID=3028392 RepID=UPI002ACD4F2D|nr:folate-binding protein YgfZ [Thiohalophilus sp.]MDZ7663143.1 folate-binding protein YgfZ [Thiohalophilus sp.]
MNSEWQTFLAQQQASIADDQVSDFGAPQDELSAADSATVIADLSHQGIISATGSDTESFLQGQFTNDVQQVTPEQSQLTAYCSPKGRMLASMRLFRRGDHYCLTLPRPLLEPTLKRLRMFVLRSNVTLEDASDALARFGIAGPDAETLLGAHLPGLPAAVDEVVQHQALTVIRIPGTQARFEIHGPAEQLIELWQALHNGGAIPVGYPAWSWLDIIAGVPSLDTDTTDAFVPQMANLHSLGGISFKKGCYTGQEVVARMHYLGTLKRRMYRAHVNLDTPPAPGEPLYSADSESSAGKVVLAQPAPNGGVDLLAVLQISSAEAGPIHLGQPNGPQLEFQELPYSVALETG